MSDTPRTDAQIKQFLGIDFIPAVVGRKFELELADKEREKEALRKDADSVLLQAREEGRREGMREAAEIINKLAENWSKGDFCPDAYDCRDAITRAAEGK